MSSSRVHEFPPPPRASSSKINGHSPQKRSSPTKDAMMRSESDMSLVPSDDELEEGRPVVHIEVRQKSTSYMQPNFIRQSVQIYLEENMTSIRIGQDVEDWREVGILLANVERIFVSEASTDDEIVKISDADLRIYVYKSSMSSEPEEFVTSADDEEDDNSVPAANITELPSLQLDGSWENLIYSDNIKERLLQYIYSTMSFSDAEVDFNIVSWNRMILLHGPPGTGKTSLCRALAHKLAIRLSDRYSFGKIIEINSHSLFSKWFSESGKLVQKLFSKVHEMVDDERGFVVVMIDEVESLTAARAGAMSGNEPSDAVRVVNALLTQLDKLKARKNVLVMTTSNIAGAIDSAFVDRADIKEMVGLPPPEAIYWILGGCVKELVAREMIKPVTILPPKAAFYAHSYSSGREQEPSLRLRKLAKQCYDNGLSGRFLRRIPLLAHARYIAGASRPGEIRPRSILKWLEAMERVVEHEQTSRTMIAQAEGHRVKPAVGTDVATAGKVE